MGQQFTIPGTLPALNELIGSAKAHWGKYKAERDGAMAKARLVIRAAKLTPFDASARVWITTTFYAPNRRKDPSNLSAGMHKVVEDALQVEGVLANDGYKNVAGYTERFFLDRDNPRIDIELNEVM